MPAVPRPISPVRMHAPVMGLHASAPPQQTGQAQRAEGMLRALEVVRSKGRSAVWCPTLKQDHAWFHLVPSVFTGPGFPAECNVKADRPIV